ncbi:MAG: 50S ribosomal protein L20 [Candidatus Dojkabacteria bacterium]|nr:50S ribosomal protein L20 [Candidatus Dojkabacteria bacterium]
MRVKTGKTTKRRHKKILKATKGYRMTKNNLYKVAHEAYMHAGQYSYNDRRKKPADMRQLWITKINAACKNNGIKYSDFIKKLTDNKINLNRKVLADIAMNEPETFSFLVKSL